MVACCSLSLAVRCRPLFAVAAVRCRLLFAVACCSLSLAVRCRSLFAVARCSLSLAVLCCSLFVVACCSLSLAVRCRSLLAVARCSLLLSVHCRLLSAVAGCSLSLPLHCRLLFACAGCSLSLPLRCRSQFFSKEQGQRSFFPHLICRNMHVDNGHQARQPRHQRFPETPGCSTLVRPCGRLYNTSRSPSAGCPTSALGMSRSRAGSDIVQNALMAALAGASPDNADPPAYVSVLSYLCR